MSHSSLRRPLIFLAFVLALVLGGFAVWQYGVHSLKTRIEQSLGPRGEVQEIRAGLTDVEILDLRIRAREGGSWPGEDELRARRILIVPDFFSCMSARPSIDNILIEGANVVLLRTKDGKVKVVPSLLDKPSEQPSATEGAKGSEDKKDGAGEVAFDIDQIIVSDGAIEFHDQSIGATPVKQRIEQIEATAGKFHLPDLAGKTELKIDAIARSSRRDGKLVISGPFDIAAKDSRLITQLRGIDLITLQPYLVKAAETGGRRGALDLDLDSSIKGGKLHAPGTVTLSDLELSDGSKSWDFRAAP
jgi:hypothetical protein